MPTLIDEVQHKHKSVAILHMLAITLLFNLILKQRFYKRKKFLSKKKKSSTSKPYLLI